MSNDYKPDEFFSNLENLNKGHSHFLVPILHHRKKFLWLEFLFLSNNLHLYFSVNDKLSDFQIRRQKFPNPSRIRLCRLFVACQALQAFFWYFHRFLRQYAFFKLFRDKTGQRLRNNKFLFINIIYIYILNVLRSSSSHFPCHSPSPHGFFKRTNSTLSPVAHSITSKSERFCKI